MKAAQIKVFIAGEHPIYRELRRQYLRNMGFRQISCFDNGRDCLRQMHQHPDIILIDQTLLPVSGLDLLLRIKVTYPHSYILFIAKRQHRDLAEEAIRAGAYDYIIKGEQEEEQITDAVKKIRQLMEHQLLYRGAHWPVINSFSKS